MKLITFHTDAEAEITEAARDYECHKLGLGSDFLGEVERGARPDFSKPGGLPANSKESAQEAFVAIPVQSDLRCICGSNSNCSMHSPETAAFLLAKAVKRQGLARRPDQSLDLTGKTTGKSALRWVKAGNMNFHDRKKQIVLMREGGFSYSLIAAKFNISISRARRIFLDFQEDGGQRTEDGGQRTEDGGRRTEDRGRRTED